MAIVNMNHLPLVLLGAGGHAKVVLALARAAGYTVQGVCDPGLARQGVDRWRGLAVLGGDEALDTRRPDEVALANGVGQLTDSSFRKQLFERFSERGFVFPALVHPAAWVDPSAVLGAGTQVMAGAVLQADVRVGHNTIINTGARIDHDCQVGSHVHVAPGAILCGTVRLGDQAFVGGGAVIIQDLQLGPKAIVGAGLTLRTSLPAEQRFLGSD